MTTDDGPESGQALLEASISAILAAVLAAGAWAALAAGWNRVACAHAAFEGARRALEGRAPAYWFGIRVVTREAGDGVEGRAKCGGREEVVRLPSLERMR